MAFLFSLSCHAFPEDKEYKDKLCMITSTCHYHTVMVYYYEHINLCFNQSSRKENMYSVSSEELLQGTIAWPFTYALSVSWSNKLSQARVLAYRRSDEPAGHHVWEMSYRSSIVEAYPSLRTYVPQQSPSVVLAFPYPTHRCIMSHHLCT